MRYLPAFSTSKKVFLGALLAFSLSASAQESTPSAPAAPAPQAPASAAAAASTSAPTQSLVLGPGDEGDISVYGVPDLTQRFRVNSGGEISLALIGTVQVAGLTADQVQEAVEKRYTDGGFLKNPHVTVTVKDYTTQGITVLGEVMRPGTYSALNVRRLFDAFLAAGGLSPRAGNTVTVTHGTDNKVHTYSLTSDPVQSVANNVAVQPGDTIIVSRAGIVYVLGEVTRPGGFVIDNPQGKMTLMQAMAMASGPTRMAALGKARILRRTEAGLENKELDLKKVMTAKSADIPLQADDIIFVPPSRGKLAAERGAGSILSMVTQLAIYHF